MNASSSAQRLKKANLRATGHRVHVLDTLMRASEPLTHQEIQERLGEESLDRVTLYRILSSLKDACLIHQVQGTDGVWRFCAHDENMSMCPGGHPHLLCESCGKMMCLTESRMPHIEVPEAFVVTHKQMLILGICKNCLQTSEKKI